VRNILFIVVVSLLAACNSNKIATIQEEEIPKSVTNYLTEQYKDFPGTKLSLLAAAEFTYDNAVAGWTSTSKGSWIIASPLQSKPLLAAGVYKARLGDKSRPDAIDGTLLNEWDIALNSRPSRLFKIQTSLGGDDHLQYVLFTGDTAYAYRVIGNVHEDEFGLAPIVKKTVLSIFFDPERQIIPGQSPVQTSASPCNCPK
jgi:hypothetical protein